MAASSLKIIRDHIKSKIIVWLVPSETILSQTYKNLSDSSHAYNKKICADFGNVEIYTKEQLLAGENFSPSFILELTATPKENSNVISYVPAWKLKSAGRVKLPVIVYNRHTQKEVISDAISFRDRLEKISVAEKIRPIILFQAESKGKGDRITFEKIKIELIKNFDIPAEQIAIKTAEINDLKNIDLMAEDCQIRFIITINALKEGWDCPFA